MPRPNRTVALLAGLLFLLQAWGPMQVVAAMAAEAAARVAAESLCLHGEDGQPRPAAPDSHRHHTLCPACTVCCTVPAALPVGASALPLPRCRGRLRHVRVASPSGRRAPRHRPNARGPPRRWNAHPAFER